MILYLVINTHFVYPIYEIWVSTTSEGGAYYFLPSLAPNDSCDAPGAETRL